MSHTNTAMCTSITKLRSACGATLFFILFSLNLRILFVHRQNTAMVTRASSAPPAEADITIMRGMGSVWWSVLNWRMSLAVRQVSYHQLSPDEESETKL